MELYKGIIFNLPEQPFKKDIAGYELPKHKQKWRRTDIPENFDSMSDEEQFAFADQEDKRCTDGYWFMNNGEPTYITGDHYHYLNWCKLDVGYPDYRDVDRRWFYAWFVVVVDTDCTGLLYAKKRRDGFSYRAMACMLNKARKTFNGHFGMMSKTGEDAKDLFAKLVYYFQEYPTFFKPQVQSAEDVKKELMFKSPIQKVTHKTRTVTKEISLNTKVTFRNTKDNSYDGSKLNILTGDECLDPETNILCEGGVFRKIKDIKIGDKVIVEGGALKTVGNVFSGVDNMYLVKQPYSKDYIVSSKHRLYLNTGNGRKKKHIVKITPEEYLLKSSFWKRVTIAVRSSGVEFDEKPTPIDAYLLGLWIGDGISGAPSFVCNTELDIEIINYLKEYADKNGYKLSEIALNKTDKASVMYLNDNNLDKGIVGNRFNNLLKGMDVFNNKHIPDNYKYNSIENRLKLLAGIIDTDGHCRVKSGSIEVAMSRKWLIDDIRFIAMSCGLSVSPIKEKRTNFDTLAYRIMISGDLSIIPMKIKRKQFTDYKKSYASRRNKVRVEPIGIGNYVGIQLIADNDDDRRLILDDFTITMNCGKFIGASFTKWLSIAKTCLMVGGRIIGKGLFGSSVNEAEHGGEEFKEVWGNSIASEKNANGRTISGLYRYFVPAYDGLEGFVDEYGMSVVEDPAAPVMGIDGLAIKIGAKTYLENELDALKKKGDIVGYYERLRQFPRDEDDLFRDPANEKTIFDLDRLYAQIEHNQVADYKLVRGNFEWRNGERDTEVVWQPTEQGKWLIYWKPKEINQKTTKYGKVAPVETNTGLFSLDPYSAVKTAGKKHSMAASHGFRKLDLMDEANSNCFVTEYWARPSDPLEVYEDMIKQCVYFGWKVLIERNVRNCFDYFRVRGYDNYLMARPESTFTEHSEDREPGLPNFSEAVRVVLMETLQSYISNNIGFIESKDKYGVMPFNNTLKDWVEFNPEKWTDYDLTVAAMIAVVGSKGLLPTKKVTKQTMELFKSYRNDGNRSYEYVPKT